MGVVCLPMSGRYLASLSLKVRCINIRHYLRLSKVRSCLSRKENLLNYNAQVLKVLLPTSPAMGRRSLKHVACNKRGGVLALCYPLATERIRNKSANRILIAFAHMHVPLYVLSRPSLHSICMYAPRNGAITNLTLPSVKHNQPASRSQCLSSAARSNPFRELNK